MKTLQDELNELQEAWKELVLVVIEELKIPELVRWLNSKLEGRSR